jgi:hypothetical protein
MTKGFSHQPNYTVGLGGKGKTPAQAAKPELQFFATQSIHPFEDALVKHGPIQFDFEQAAALTKQSAHPLLRSGYPLVSAFLMHVPLPQHFLPCVDRKFAKSCPFVPPVQFCWSRAVHDPPTDGDGLPLFVGHGRCFGQTPHESLVRLTKSHKRVPTPRQRMAPMKTIDKVCILSESRLSMEHILLIA